MLQIFVAELLGLVVVLRVIVAIRQSEPALVGHGDHLRAVLIVLRGTETEIARAHPPCSRATSASDLAETLQIRDALEFRLNGLHARGLDVLFHPCSSLEIADLLQIRAGRGGLVLRRFLENLMQNFFVIVTELIEGSPNAE